MPFLNLLYYFVNHMYVKTCEVCKFIVSFLVLVLENCK